MRAMYKLLQLLKEHYGDKLEVSVVDHRNPLSIWYSIRYWAWLTSWVLNGKKAFEGIPELGELKHLIDEALETKLLTPVVNGHS